MSFKAGHHRHALELFDVFFELNGTMLASGVEVEIRRFGCMENTALERVLGHCVSGRRCHFPLSRGQVPGSMVLSSEHFEPYRWRRRLFVPLSARFLYFQYFQRLGEVLCGLQWRERADSLKYRRRLVGLDDERMCVFRLSPQSFPDLLHSFLTRYRSRGSQRLTPCDRQLQRRSLFHCESCRLVHSQSFLCRHGRESRTTELTHVPQGGFHLIFRLVSGA